MADRKGELETRKNNRDNTGNDNEPDVLSAYHKTKAVLWNLITALRGGTEAMREQTTTFLPKEEKEHKNKYANRVKRSFLFNAYDEAVSTIASKPFSKEVVVVGDEDNEFIELIKLDADKEGRNITQFGHDLYDSGVDRGMVSILVDFSRNADEDGKPLSLGAQREQGIRPCFIMVPRQNILGYREDPDNPGKFLQVRIFDQVTEPAGEFGEVLVDIVRVYEPTKWSIWKRKPDNNQEWQLDDDGDNSLGEVPLVNIYFNRTGFMEANPTLASLAWLNLQHYQSSSDQNNILRFARTGTFFGAGFSRDEIKTTLVVGVDNMIKSTQPDAKLTVVEFSGKAVEAGAADLKQIEDRMETMGHQPMLQPAATATGEVIQDTKTITFAQLWVRATSAGLVKAYKLAYQWYDQEIPEDFAVNIFEDFSASIQSDKSMEQVLAVNDRGLLTNETTLKEMQRRDIVSADVDIEKELTAAQSEFATRSGTQIFGDDQKFDDEGNPIPKEPDPKPGE